MKITIAGSFHEPGWSEVCALAKKLKKAGHTIVAPNIEANPIDNNATYVKFSGEEKKTPAELEKSFLRAVEDSDALVVCNLNQRIGFAVSLEVGYAMTNIGLKKSTLKHIYFMLPPVGYCVFKAKPQMLPEEFAREIQTNPKYVNEWNDFMERTAKTGMISYSSIEDYYKDLKRLYGMIKDCESRGEVTIGIDSLLKNKVINDEREI